MTEPNCPASGKTGSYLTWEQADGALKRIKKRRNVKNLPRLTHVYRCPSCRMYHLTSQPRQQTKAFKEREIRQRKRKMR